MTIAVFIASETHATSLIPWAVRFAHADHRDLLIVCPRRTKGKKGWVDLAIEPNTENALHRAIAESVNSHPFADWDSPDSEKSESTSDESRVLVSVKEIVAPDPETAFGDDVNELDSSLLLIPSYEPSRAADSSSDWSSHVMANARCETIILRGKPPGNEQPISILVATRGDSETETALMRACHLSGNDIGNISILFVASDYENLADEKWIAIQVARRQLDRVLGALSLATDDLRKHVVMNDSLRNAIDQHCESNSVDIVIVGTRSSRTIRALFRQTDSAKEQSTSTYAAIRDAVPMSSRVWKQLKEWTRARVPQLERDARVKLVERLQTSSTFDFDFVALISLSTLIAALGLLRNSSAVVIGAMLVAPLMVPLVGTGFGLVQGNVLLVRNAMRSVVLGFALAYCLAFLTGILVPGIVIQSEMTARGAPDLLDMIVALLSGVAAAYAMGRPNLVSALPGVAIAAALVPPISTSGMALAVWCKGLCSWPVNIGDPNFTSGPLDLAGGSLLLFLTNIFAIILGTAIAFGAVGIDTRAEAKTAEGRGYALWPRYGFVAFFLVSLLLAAIMTIRNGVSRPEPYNPSSGTTQSLDSTPDK